MGDPDSAALAKMAANNSRARPSTAAELDDLELREARLIGQVCEIEDIQAAVAEIKAGLTGAKNQDHLQQRLDDLDRKSGNLELYGLSMLELQREVSELKHSMEAEQKAKKKASK